MQFGKATLAALLAGSFALAACATVVRGSSEPVTFDSEPSGAEMRSIIKSPCGGPCPASGSNSAPNTPAYPDENSKTPPEPGPSCLTPCTINVARNKELIVTFTKPGFETQTVELQTHVAPQAVATAGNVILGGAVGLATDAMTQAGMDHKPNPLKVTLKPLAPVAPPPKRR
jgi:hypothetical protein